MKVPSATSVYTDRFAGLLGLILFQHSRQDTLTTPPLAKLAASALRGLSPRPIAAITRSQPSIRASSAMAVEKTLRPVQQVVQGQKMMEGACLLVLQSLLLLSCVQALQLPPSALVPDDTWELVPSPAVLGRPPHCAYW